MAITIRDMLAEVMLYRPDIVETEHGMWALRKATEEIARRTMLLKTQSATTNYNAGTAASTFTPTSGKLVRIERLRAASLSVETPDYKGTWNATTDTPALATPDSSNVGFFYIVSTAGTYSSTDYNVGDIVVQRGSAWERVAVEEFLEIGAVNKPTMEITLRSAQASTGFPYGWAQDNNALVFYPKLQYDTAMIVNYSYVPADDFDDIDFPQDAEEVIINGALQKIMLLPGEGRNINLAMEFGKSFERGINNLKAISWFGMSGSPYYNAGNFAGRQTF